MKTLNFIGLIALAAVTLHGQPPTTGTQWWSTTPIDCSSVDNVAAGSSYTVTLASGGTGYYCYVSGTFRVARCGRWLHHLAPGSGTRVARGTDRRRCRLLVLRHKRNRPELRCDVHLRFVSRIRPRGQLCLKTEPAGGSRSAGCYRANAPAYSSTQRRFRIRAVLLPGRNQLSQRNAAVDLFRAAAHFAQRAYRLGRFAMDPVVIRGHRRRGCESRVVGDLQPRFSRHDLHGPGLRQHRNTGRDRHDTCDSRVQPSHGEGRDIRASSILHHFKRRCPPASSRSWSMAARTIPRLWRSRMIGRADYFDLDSAPGLGWGHPRACLAAEHQTCSPPPRHSHWLARDRDESRHGSR